MLNINKKNILISSSLAIVTVTTIVSAVSCVSQDGGSDSSKPSNGNQSNNGGNNNDNSNNGGNNNDNSNNGINQDKTPLSKRIEMLYGNVSIKPIKGIDQLYADEKQFPITNITPDFFEGLPQSKEDIIVEILNVKKYDIFKGEITITIRYSRSNEHIDKEYVISGFKAKTIDELVDETYQNIDVKLTDEGKKMTADENKWTIDMINSTYFIGLPENKNNIIVKVISIEPNENDCNMKIKFEFQKKDFQEKAYRTIEVTDFKAYPINDKINELYPNVNITLTPAAKALTAEEKNWPVKNINSKYFLGLPTKQGIITQVNPKSVDCKPNERAIYITFEFKKGTVVAERTYRVDGFKNV